MKTILTRFSSLAVMVLLMVILVLPQNAQAAVSLVDLQAALSSLQAKLTQLVGGGQTAQVLSSVADTDVLLDLQLDAGGPTDGSAYASNVSTRKQYDLESALGKKVYRVSDYASISVDRSNKQIYNLEKGSFEFNFKRFTPATGVGPLVTIYQSWKISLTIAGEISFYFPSSDGTAYTITTSGANIMDVAWHNVVVNFDGSAGVAEIYVDGVLRGQGAVGGTTKPVKYWGLTIPDQYNDSFDGYMDGLRMYARPLTVAEVKTAASQLQTQVSYGDIAAPDYVRPADLKKIPSAPFSATKTVSDAAGLTSALSAAKEGDVILLQSGNYGDFAITKYFTSYITIAAAAGATPVFNSLDVTGSYIHVSGVTITPATAVHALDLNGLHNVFENSTIQFGDIDISGWDATKWKTTAGGGIYTAGFQNIIRNNTLTNVGFGIVNTGSYGLISNNRIDGYSGDAMRSLGHYMIVENNYAINCIEVDANHDDMFQAWTRSEDSNKTLYGVVLRGNVFINNDNRPAAAVIGTTQGIGLFDGFYENWLIENNFIMVNSYHGIGIYGAKNITIKNNTVIDSKDGTPGPLWIGIFNHKNGTVPENVTIENNLSNRIAGTGTGVTKTNNASVSFANYENYFVDIANFDYRLKSSAPVSGVGADPNYVPTALPVAHTGATVAQSSDTDGDGIVDTKDNCVNIANRDQQDSDQDGLGDVCDTTPNGDTTPAGDTTTDTTQDPVTEDPTTTDETPVDTTTPAITFEGIEDGDTISGKVYIAALPVDVGVVNSVTFRIDGVAKRVEYNSPYTITGDSSSFDTTTLTDGRHIFAVTVDGSTADVTASVTVTVENQVVTEEPATPAEDPAVSTEQRVVTTENLNVRATANGTKLGTQPRGSYGSYDTAATAVTAAGYTWVYVNFDKTPDGYVAKEYLTNVDGTTITEDQKRALLLSLLRQLQALQEQLNALMAAQ